MTVLEFHTVIVQYAKSEGHEEALIRVMVSEIVHQEFNKLRTKRPLDGCTKRKGIERQIIKLNRTAECMHPQSPAVIERPIMNL